MRRVYEYFSTYKTEDSVEKHDRLTEIDLEFIDSLELIDLHYDGEKYTWKDEKDNTELTIIVCTEDEINKIKEIDFRLHYDVEGYSKVTDVTNDVLMGVYDCDRYGFAREIVMAMLYDWRRTYLEDDDLLDKINKYGANSLTQQEKDFLETGVLNNPFHYERVDDVE